MLEPKVFYREMDLLLRQIGRKRSKQNFLLSIMRELEVRIATKMHFANGRLYEKRGEALCRVFQARRNQNSVFVDRVMVDARIFLLLMSQGSHIYHEFEFVTDPLRAQNVDGAFSAAFVVESSNTIWLFCFDLEEGWNRDEILFCFNAVRSALNYRLLMDSVKNQWQEAARIQKSLLPSYIPPVAGYDIASYSQPAELLGGDFYDFLNLDNNVFGIVAGDASGHGLSAALVVRDVITGLRMGLFAEMKMVNALKKLNEVIQRNTISSRFVSLVYGELEKKGNFVYVNAGHPPPLVLQRDRVTALAATGTILGALPEIDLHRANIQLEAGDSLVIYSDGIIEHKNEHRKQFGLRRLQRLLLENRNSSASDIMEIVFRTVYEFGSGANWKDDTTVVVIKRLNHSE